MFESATRSLDWNTFNNDEKYDMCEFLLQKTKYRNFHLMVANKNLRNKLKTMENEMREVKEALSLEEFQCNLLTENVESKLKEGRQYRVREDKLCYEIRALQSDLCKERSRSSILKERLVQFQAILERTPFKALSQRFCHVIDRLRRTVRRKRNSVADENQDS